MMTDDDDHRRTPASGQHTFSHRRRWSTPVDPGVQNITALEIKSDPESRGGEFVSCSSDNSYSFYLEGKKSPWGSSGPPLLTSNALRGGGGGGGEERRGRSVERKRDLPPYLTTLDCNGRPRFNHRRVRSEGRLEICSVAVESPEIVSVRGRGGLRIGTVRINQPHDEDDDEDEQPLIIC